jgi:DNA-binding GntR family transcriptional regulator
MSVEQPVFRIDQSIVDAILGGRLRPGARLGELALAKLFDVSRTSVREVLIRLQTRGLVESSPRRGWFVVEPSLEDVQIAFQARRAIETGILLTMAKVTPAVVAALRNHVARQRDAIAAEDVAARSFLLADFHVCLVEALGNRILVDLLRDLTARTVLIASLYQSTQDATVACDEHEAITSYIAEGDLAGAARLMTSHIDNVEVGLTKRIERDPLVDLRSALQPRSGQTRTQHDSD